MWMCCHKSCEMGDVLFCFSCCITQQPPQRRRRRIDRTMIGYPTNFVHTGHIGAGDVTSCNNTSNHLQTVENQMTSKGGYDHVTSVDVQLNVIDVRREES